MASQIHTLVVIPAGSRPPAYRAPYLSVSNQAASARYVRGLQLRKVVFVDVAMNAVDPTLRASIQGAGATQESQIGYA